MNCLHCGAETSNGLALCDQCQHKLSVACVDTAAFYADVERINPGQRVKAKSAYRSAPPPGTEPARDPISDDLSHADTIVSGWARNLADDRPGLPPVPRTTVLACAWLEQHRVTIATLEWAGECVREMTEVKWRLRNRLDRADTGNYAGVCGNEIGREDTPDGPAPVHCERHLYVAHGTTWVACPECGRTWDASERRAEMLRQARNELAPVRVIANVVVQFTDEPSAERLTRRIEQWVTRGQLRDYGVRVLDGRPRRVYRIDDVLRLVTGEVLPREMKAC